jgi:hypothetical protein
VANVYAEQIRNSEGYDPEKDTVIVRGVKTKEDFEGVIMEANGQENDYGKIEQLALVSHSGPAHGPIFQYGTPQQDQYFKPTEQLPKLWFNWSQTAEAKFLGCNTAVNFAQNFANAQRVPAWGFDTFSSISSSPDKKTKGYWFKGPFYKGPLYMVGNDGRGMIRRDPAPKDTPRK